MSMPAPSRPGAVREFAGGVATLGRGFGYWARRPGAMALGLIPAAIVGLALIGALVALAFALPGLVEAITPFADGWEPFWAGALRIAAGTAILGAGIVVAVVSFTALTLIVGEPFYDRIWRAVEDDLGGECPDSTYGFWRSLGDGIGLVARGLLAALAAALLGLVPLVGAAASAAAAVTLTGWLLADELTSRALSARGLGADARRRLRRAHRARVLGFGVATQLCFLVPLGAVVAMPAAVAGSTILARRLLSAEQA